MFIFKAIKYNTNIFVLIIDFIDFCTHIENFWQSSGLWKSGITGSRAAATHLWSGRTTRTSSSSILSLLGSTPVEPLLRYHGSFRHQGDSIAPPTGLMVTQYDQRRQRIHPGMPGVHQGQEPQATFSWRGCPWSHMMGFSQQKLKILIDRFFKAVHLVALSGLPCAKTSAARSLYLCLPCFARASVV